MAVKRLECLKNKLRRNQEFQHDYQEFMRELIQKGFAEKVDNIEPTIGKTWYIPHHGVYNPHKPGKIRVVFDCAAKFQGTSLNNLLLPGSNMTNSLVGVLLRFREDPVAIMADIEAMFHQVKVPVKDRDYMRFFWWPEGDVNQQPVECRMTAHLFGAASSPARANMALRQTALDNRPSTEDEVTQLLY
ncbi:uncharacterized protein [Antedon mediterranea]|uniref:uncharacterized protein n=1 Tax=Antedon mediterranea TaxID=105859 RepID=UPI003AF639FD